MKRTAYYLILLVFALVSCDPMEDINQELKDMDTGFRSNLTYALTEDDYADIADLALEADETDTDNAGFIASRMYFTDAVPAADYIPLLIADMYPGLGLGSTVDVTYNYSGDMPEDYAMYTEAADYELSTEEYSSFDGILEVTGYYSPAYPPEVYLPEVLAAGIADPSNGDMVLVEYLYSGTDAKVDFESASDVTVWSEGFDTDLGVFTATSVVGAQEWAASSYGDDAYAKISGYSGGAQDNEDWLISSAISIDGIDQPALHVTQAAKYLNDQWDQITVLVSTDYDGSDIAGATWDEQTFTTLPSGSDYVFVASEGADLSGYAGQDIYVALKYLSTTANAATWEVDEVVITTPGAATVIGPAPETRKDFYEYSNGEWTKAEGVYNVQAEDYNAMGSPGKYDNFSSSDVPGDYIPALLDEKYPLAGESVEVVVVYRYYAGSTMTLASTYTKTAGTWASSYDYVTETSGQFLYGSSGWVFDPTITFTLSAADFQIIVDYVESNFGASYIDSYGTGDYYYGASAYYGNFDMRDGHWNADVFGSAEEAIAEAIALAVLPAKYPNITTQVNGVDMYFVVNYAYYNGANGSGSVKYQVTKSGPDPEFTLVD
ncbi:MAG: choice-of-anchor J domain-containing protein [Bacteroidales bacterium]